MAPKLAWSDPAENEDLIEHLARTIVAAHLGLEVKRFEDGTAPRQVDAVIHRGSARIPLEVVSDNDVPYLRQWDALEKVGRTISTPGHPGWFVSVKHSASVRQLHRELPRALAEIASIALVEDLDGSMPASLRRLGVTYFAPRSHGGEETIQISEEGWNNWDDPIELNPWVERVLQRERDVPEKLRAFPSAETHAFIWATTGSAMTIHSRLVNDDEFDRIRFPVLKLPDGVTDVWVASTQNRRGCLHHSNGLWERTSWITPGKDLQI
jgi:hypothetical protein